MVRSLRTTLEENADIIVPNWARSLKQMRGSGYDARSLEGLQKDCNQAFRGILETLEVGTFTPLIEFLENETRDRIPMGFGLSSMLRAFHNFKPTVWPILKEEYAGDASQLAQASEEIDTCIISVICELADLYLRETDRRIKDYIKQNEEINRRFLRLSIVDGLTGLYNHKYFHSVLDKEVRRVKRYGGPLSLIMFDIDQFQKVNEAYSYERGDEVLQGLGTLLARSFREVDTVARYGGEEFCVILPQTGKENATVKADMVRKTVEEESLLVIGAEKIPITVSAGVTGVDEAAFEKLKLITDLEREVIRAKREGRNRVAMADDRY